MIIAGLTGGIASGKSTVSEMFTDLGAYLIDWDLLAREVVEPHKKAWNAIVDYFGAGVLNDDHTLNREKLGQIVFDDPEKLQMLNQITHPAVIEEDEERLAQIAQRDPAALVIKDIPLLIEIGLQNTVEKIIVVQATPETQLQRMLGRGFSEAEARKRIAAQMPVEEKVGQADFVIRNDGSIIDTQKQVRQIFEALKPTGA